MWTFSAVCAIRTVIDILRELYKKSELMLKIHVTAVCKLLTRSSAIVKRTAISVTIIKTQTTIIKFVSGIRKRQILSPGKNKIENTNRITNEN